ncbi:response regulator [Thalassotalea euphylliae]|uniref:Response regulator n=1 Tax=Thalassotalea euphylliae TaxID=1655234 RepID=A0A3E0UH99_9GAMM|nr:response regulator [Thalassotalea euphylliae]REL36259.1 response regulator [Thalassotalea euphylliae]
MPTKLLICDDSNMARKQVARSLPEDWEVDVSFAENGEQAIAAIKAGKGDVLLLDLNMPVMDGYQVLETIVKEDLPTLTVVISGDIQPEAHQRVTGMGALDFIQKPVNKDKLTEILLSYGIFTREELSTSKANQEATTKSRQDKIELPAINKPVPKAQEVKERVYQPITLAPDLRDCYQEIANVAMGRAGDLLARLLDVFVLLPIPNVNLIEVSELRMALTSVATNETTSGVCQGFIGAGVSGEALLILNDSSFKEIASLMNYHQDIDESAELELLMDMANTLIGACLSGVSEQLDMTFSQGHPVVLGQHRNIKDLIATNSAKWRQTLAIEISYNIENYSIKCDLLLLFTEESMRTLNNKISYLLD